MLITHQAPEATQHGIASIVSVVREAGVELIVSPAEAAKHPILREFVSPNSPPFHAGGADVILVAGGDGSILRALARQAGTGAPVVGINYGRVGFLASIERGDIERDLRRLFAGEYSILGLPSLRVQWSDGAVEAVNDLAILRGGESRIADLTYDIDGERVATVRCDGLIASTPVGSTAYNLAAGGPTVSWRVRCYVVSFIAAHHLDTRPLVIAPEETLTITNAAVIGDCDILSDGKRVGSLAAGRSISVGLGGSEVHLGIFPEASFFRRYREKFGRP
jgi:NAD+ kinase